MRDVATTARDGGGRDPDPEPPSAISAMDQLRRFRAHWFCDRSFREALLIDAKAAVASRGLHIDPEGLRICWDRDYRADIDRLPRAEALKHISGLALGWLGLNRQDRDYRR